MKKLIYSVMILLVSLWCVSGLCFAGEGELEEWWNTEDIWKRNLNDNPVKILDYVNGEANKKISNEVQNTDLDVISSKSVDTCDWIAPDVTFSITRTLCSIKQNAKDYLQYVVYFGLAAATFFLIRKFFLI